MDLVVKNLQTVNAKYTLFLFPLSKSSGKISDVKNFGQRKFRTVKFSDTLLSELFLRPNFFVINVFYILLPKNHIY